MYRVLQIAHDPLFFTWQFSSTKGGETRVGVGVGGMSAVLGGGGGWVLGASTVFPEGTLLVWVGTGY